MENTNVTTPQQSEVTQIPLPNATTVLVFGIISIVLCWCHGIFGLILAIIALVLANKDLVFIMRIHKNTHRVLTIILKPEEPRR